MKHFEAIINAVVSVRVRAIEADTPDEAANKGLLAVESQLDHIFDRRITENVDTFFSEDIPAIMIDQVSANPDLDKEPIETTWVRCDIPSDDLTVFAAIEDVLRTYNQTERDGTDPFASADLKSKMELLDKAYDALPKILARTKSVES